MLRNCSEYEKQQIPRVTVLRVVLNVTSLLLKSSEGGYDTTTKTEGPVKPIPFDEVANYSTSKTVLLNSSAQGGARASNKQPIIP